MAATIYSRILSWPGAWLRRILLMHLSAAYSRTLSSAATPAAGRSIREYLGAVRPRTIPGSPPPVRRHGTGPVTIPG